MTWEKGEGLHVHEVCRKRYAAKAENPPAGKKRRIEIPMSPPSSIPRPELARTETSEPSTSSTSQSESTISQPSTRNLVNCSEFDFKNLCFLCGNNLDPRHKDIRRVKDHLLKNRLLSIAESRNDDFGEEVISRLQGTYSLVDARTPYHKVCYTKLTQKCYAKPHVDNTQNEQAFRNVMAHIENANTFKFNLSELRDIMGENTISDTILFKKLKETYGDEIVIIRHSGRQPKILYKQFDIVKLCSDWFCSDGTISDRQRGIIYQVAADMLRTEIMDATSNTTSYCPPAEFLRTVSTDIPPNLQTFLGHLLYKNDPDQESENRGIRDSIAHAIVSVLRPRGFISNLQLAIGTYIHRKTGSKLVIDLLCKLGLCASYHNIKLFELSNIMDSPKMNVEENSFVQFVFDNTDHNFATLDGRETLHCLGGIAVYTPEENISYEGGSKKLKIMPTTGVIASQKRIPIIPYETSNRNVIGDFTFSPVNSLRLGEAALFPCTY